MKISSSYFEKDEKTKSWNNRNTTNEITNLFGEKGKRFRFPREREREREIKLIIAAKN